MTTPAKTLEPAPAPCVHAWGDFPLPGESKGRVMQCKGCGAVGYRKNRHGGGGRIELYTCSRQGCAATARHRMTGRGPRGAYIWSCTAHNVLIGGLDRLAPEVQK